MKKLFQAMIHGMLLFTAIYLIGSFVAGNFDITSWPQEGRALTGLLGGGASIVLTLISYKELED